MGTAGIGGFSTFGGCFSGVLLSDRESLRSHVVVVEITCHTGIVMCLLLRQHGSKKIYILLFPTFSWNVDAESGLHRELPFCPEFPLPDAFWKPSALKNIVDVQILLMI